jgi:hypothetical protein
MTAMAANAVANNRKAAARRLLEARRIVALEGRGGRGLEVSESELSRYDRRGIHARKASALWSRFQTRRKNGV